MQVPRDGDEMMFEPDQDAGPKILKLLVLKNKDFLFEITSEEMSSEPPCVEEAHTSTTSNAVVFI